MHVRLDAASARCPTGTTRQGRGCSKSACPTFAARRVVSHCTDRVEKLNKVGAGAATAAAAVAGSRISFITSEPPRQLRFQINVNSNRRGIDAPIRARFSTQLPTQSKSDSNRGNTSACAICQRLSSSSSRSITQSIPIMSRRIIASTDLCAHCNKGPPTRPELSRCSKCRLSMYCSPECQKAAWKQHKKVCHEAPTLKSTPPDAPVAGVRVKGPIFHPKNVTVAPDHPVWTKGTVAPISQLIGLPILIHRDEQEHGLDVANIESRDVQSITYLMIRPEIGLADMRWQKNIGTCTVVRADQKPLTQVALEMIWMYCDRILDVFNVAGPSNDVYAMYKPQPFRTFCEEYKEQYMQIPTRKADFENLSLPLQ